MESEIAPIKVPDTSHGGCFRFNRLKLYKACRELHDECVDFFGAFCLVTEDVKKFPSIEWCLISYLKEAHRKHGISLPLDLWMPLIMKCLEMGGAPPDVKEV